MRQNNIANTAGYKVDLLIHYRNKTSAEGNTRKVRFTSPNCLKSNLSLVRSVYTFLPQVFCSCDLFACLTPDFFWFEHCSIPQELYQIMLMAEAEGLLEDMWQQDMQGVEAILLCNSNSKNRDKINGNRKQDQEQAN